MNYQLNRKIPDWPSVQKIANRRSQKMASTPTSQSRTPEPSPNIFSKPGPKNSIKQSRPPEPSPNIFIRAGPREFHQVSIQLMDHLVQLCSTGIRKILPRVDFSSSFFHRSLLPGRSIFQPGPALTVPKTFKSRATRFQKNAQKPSSSFYFFPFAAVTGFIFWRVFSFFFRWG